MFAPRLSDDVFHRIQVLAESRATRNGLDAPAAGRKAVALVKQIKVCDPDLASLNMEHVLQTVAGCLTPAQKLL